MIVVSVNRANQDRDSNQIFKWYKNREIQKFGNVYISDFNIIWKNLMLQVISLSLDPETGPG